MISKTLRERRSVRRFRSDPVPRELALELVEAAICAPSASNKQPWRFLLVESRSTIAALAESVRRAVAEIAATVPAESEAAFRAYGDYFTRFEHAPLVVVPIYKPLSILSNLVGDALSAGRRAAITEMEAASGLMGGAMALQNLLLQAHELGLGASAMTGPLVAHAELCAALTVPNGWSIAALVPVGYPDEEPTPPGRKGVEKVVRWIE